MSEKFKIKNNIATRKSVLEKIIYTIVFIYLVIHSICLIYPFIWLFVSSFKSAGEYLLTNPFSLPKVWKFGNYPLVFDNLVANETNFFGMLFNSVWYTAGTTLAAVFMSSLVAYNIAQHDFGVKKFMYAVIIMVMIIPSLGGGVSAYQLAIDFGYINTPFIIITSMGGYGGFQFLVLYACYKGISKSYAEAAYIDGAGEATVYFKVMLPLAMGPVASIAVVTAIGCWNDYMTPLIYLYEMPTLSTGLYIYGNRMQRAINYPVYFAGIIITMIPIMVLFGFAQKMVMKSINIGGLKG